MRPCGEGLDLDFHLWLAPTSSEVGGWISICLFVAGRVLSLYMHTGCYN